MEKVKSLITKTHIPYWLAGLLSLVFILRIPSLLEPYYYGDEMIYLTVGNGIKHGLSLYKEIFDNKPPLLYLLAAVSGSLFWFKAILAIWNLVTIYLFWKLLKALFPENINLSKIATVTFGLLTCLPLFEGNIVNAEIFTIGLSIWAFLIIYSQENSPQNLLLAGLLFSLATLFKVPAIFDLFALIAYWVIEAKINKQHISKILNRSLYLILGFLLPLLITFVWAYYKDFLPEYIGAAFSQNVGYLSSWRPSDYSKPFILRNLPLLIRASIVLTSLGLLYIFKTKISKQFLFSFVWLVFGLFAATLSERPYPHYLIQVLPPFSIFVGFFLASKNMEQIYSLIAIFIFSLVPFYYKYYHYSSAAYYLRFINFASHQMDINQYFSDFGPDVQRNYRIADFIKKHVSDQREVFIWGDSAPIYALSQKLPPLKYTTSYHLKDYSSPDDLVSSLSALKPKFIILLPGEPAPRQLLSFLYKNYFLFSLENGTETWRSLAAK